MPGVFLWRRSAKLRPSCTRKILVPAADFASGIKPGTDKSSMIVHSTTIERSWAGGETRRKRVTVVGFVPVPGEKMPAEHVWAGWTILETVDCVLRSN
jgi:hypothetical protein